MHDIKWIRDNPAAFDAGLARRGLPPVSGELQKLDEQRREIVTKLQEAQSRRNAASKDIGKAKAAKDNATADRLMAEVAALKDDIAKGEEAERGVDAKIRAILEVIPNLPLAEVPDGADEHGNKLVRTVGEPAKFAWTNKPKQHFEIGEELGLMDFETAQKISGARFVVLKGAVARLERALGQFMLDVHTGEKGYTENVVPLLVRDDAVYGTGSLPKFEQDLFEIYGEFRKELTSFEKKRAVQVAQDASQKELDNVNKILSVSLQNAKAKGIDVSWAAAGFIDIARVSRESATAFGKAATEFQEIAKRFQKFEQSSVGSQWLIPTAEVSLTNFVREQILDESALPMRLTALTPCFRSEAGAAGKDTRGMIRQHQFSKVELVSITTPEQSLAEHERMTACAEDILKRLGLPFRTMLLCTGDMGFQSQKTYDIEVWLPGQNAYREISSCSVCGDFQARRMNARFKAKAAKETRFVHTLNGSALAVGRTLIAVLENYQQPDGSVAIPEELRPYMGGMKTIAKP